MILRGGKMKYSMIKRVHVVRHKSYMDRRGIELGPPR